MHNFIIIIIILDRPGQNGGSSGGAGDSSNNPNSPSDGGPSLPPCKNFLTHRECRQQNLEQLRCRWEEDECVTVNLNDKEAICAQYKLPKRCNNIFALGFFFFF